MQINLLSRVQVNLCVGFFSFLLQLVKILCYACQDSLTRSVIMMPMIEIEGNKMIIEIAFDDIVASVVDDNPAMLSIIATCYQLSPAL